jgi:hypothetical protein
MANYGTVENPVRLDPYQRIIEVGWSVGRFGILEITAPDGIAFDFGKFTTGNPPVESDYISTGSLSGEFLSKDVINQIMDISLTDPEGGELYHKTDVFYLIGTVIFPDRVPPDPFAYEIIKAGIHSPNRFVEPVDLRTLGKDEFPYRIGGWPDDGNWGDPGFPWGTWSDGRPSYLPASSGADPAAPGYYVNPNWGLGEAYQEAIRQRNERKYAWLLNFTKSHLAVPPLTQDVEGIDKGTLSLSIKGPSVDDDLGGYTMSIVLRMFSPRGRFTVGAKTVTAKKLAPSEEALVPILTQTKSASYDQSGVIAHITRAGFVT